ncbi:YceI family protein [Halothiobacillus sp.]|uniref:YceI family protein n=1 Tax=Halothiobacillus sp. TaxID=1891311 RepID=UPI002AD32601|nr:YceI family protein [Halothiobacillus sp.]
MKNIALVRTQASVLALFLASASTCAFAAPSTYVIDDTHTQPRFEYNHFGFSNQVHSFNKTSGTIIYDPVAKTGSVDITIDPKSVNTGVPLLDKYLQDKDFFDSAQYPTITFKSTRVKFEGKKPVKVYGNLTIKGITKPVTLTVTSFQVMQNPIEKKEEVGANAHTRIKRSEFDMAKYAPGVSDEVTINLPVEALKK